MPVLCYYIKLYLLRQRKFSALFHASDELTDLPHRFFYTEIYTTDHQKKNAERDFPLDHAHTCFYFQQWKIHFTRIKSIFIYFVALSVFLNAETAFSWKIRAVDV
ncbi:hypothetical protein RB195_003657 [Necator americanus]|uniref:Uncharacterized protein n=1 Tax=Necator americanus TaxID=51031 RepID=A0ABR1DPK9_NECAM